MKNSINTSNNVNLIFNTYTFLFFKLLLRIFILLDSFDHGRQVSKTAWLVHIRNGNGKDLEMRKTIMVPKGLTYGMSTELPQHAPKWKSANHGLESSNDEFGIIKRSRDECMKNKY